MRIKKLAALKGCLFLGLVVATGIYGPSKLSHYLDEFWVEAAHQALLTSLVDARNHAWDHAVTVEVCAANAEQACIAPYDNNIAGWLSYEVAANGGQTKINFYSFPAEHVGITTSERFAQLTPLGFDNEGYSLQRAVIGFDVYSLSGVSDKNYTVLLEPSGALQTLVNGALRSTVRVAYNDELTHSPLNQNEG